MKETDHNNIWKGITAYSVGGLPGMTIRTSAMEIVGLGCVVRVCHERMDNPVTVNIVESLVYVPGAKLVRSNDLEGYILTSI